MVSIAACARHLDGRVVLHAAGSIALCATRALHATIEDFVSEQQLATVGSLAEEADQEQAGRPKAKDGVAAHIAASLMGDRAPLQAFLEQDRQLLSLFNAGCNVTALDAMR